MVLQRHGCARAGDPWTIHVQRRLWRGRRLQWTEVDTQLIVNDVVNDPSRDRVIASISSLMPGVGNTVAEIGPSTGAIIRQVTVGSDPGPLALSSDGSSLYVELDGTDNVVRIAMTTFTVVSSFRPGITVPSGAVSAKDIETVPGDPNAVAVAWKTPTSYAGFAVYDSGVPRTKVAPANPFVDTITFDGSPNRLFAYNARGASHEFSTWQVDPTGLTLTHSTPGLVNGSNTTIKFRAGRVQTSYGSMIDPIQRIVSGSYLVNGERGDVLPGLNRAYFVQGGTPTEFRADNYFSVSTATLEASAPITALVGTSRGLAIINASGKLSLIAARSDPASIHPLRPRRNTSAHSRVKRCRLLRTRSPTTRFASPCWRRSQPIAPREPTNSSRSTPVPEP